MKINGYQKYICLKVSLILSLFFISGISFAASKKVFIKQLADAKSENILQLREIDKKLAGDLNLNPISNTDLLSQLLKKKDEFLLRQNFFDQLIFKFNKNYTSQNLKPFIIKQLKDMGQTELNSDNRNIQFWQFVNNLAVSIETLPERNENLIEFLKGYIEVSTISKPISPKEYLKRRHYTNSTEVVTVKATSKENVGEALENEINQLESKN